jgi:hypothetical protein
MADASYLSIGASPTAAHWNTLYAEAERRLGFQFAEQSPIFWGIDARFLALRRYFVFGDTPLKPLTGSAFNNVSEYMLSVFAAGGFLPGGEGNDNFRNYDMTPFDVAETACFLRDTPKDGDPRPRTSSVAPSALVDRSTFNDAFTGSVFPSGSGAPDQYKRSFYYSPKAHRKYFTFGPEYSGSQYYCYLVVDGSIDGTYVPPVDEQAGPEHVAAFSPAEWFIFEVGGAWTFPTYETKERFHRIHNITGESLTVTFPGGIWIIPPRGCLAVRRNKDTEYAKADRGGDGVHSGYFWYYQEADPRILHPTQIVGPPLVAGSAVDQNGNNLTDPLMLVSLMYYLDGGYWGNPSTAVYDVNTAQDISSIYNSSTYTTHSRTPEIPMPAGGWYAPISDETKPCGDFLIHRGKLLFVSVNTIRHGHTQSMQIDGNQDFHLLRTEDGRVARNVSNLQMFTGSVSVPMFGPSFNWTQSTNINGTGSVFFPTGSVWNVGDYVTASFNSDDPDNWHTDDFAGFGNLSTMLARNSMSLVSATSYTSISGTYFISSSIGDIQIVQLSTNFISYIRGGNIAADPWGNITGTCLINYLDVVPPDLFSISAVTQSDDRIEWVVSSDGPGGGWANPVTTSAQLQNLWREKLSPTPLVNLTMSLFDPVSIPLDAMRNFGAPDNDADITITLRMTPFGPKIIAQTTIPVDWPLTNGQYNENFWLPSNYDSHSVGLWYNFNGIALGYYGGGLTDPGDGWGSPGNWRAGEFNTPRIRRAYGVKRTFQAHLSQSNYAISGTFPMSDPSATDENARLFSFYEYNSGSFLNFSSGSNDWRNVIASGPTVDLSRIAFVAPFGTSATNLAALNTWLDKGTASIDGGFIDYGPGSGRETSYYPNNKSFLINTTPNSDDLAIVPQVLHLTAEHFNAAASAVNHTRGTTMTEQDYGPQAEVIMSQLFPGQSIGRGFTQSNVGMTNIRPRTCYAMWDRTLNTDMANFMALSFSVTVKTSADFPDQTNFAAAANKNTVTRWAYGDFSSATIHYSDYPTGDASLGSQSLWTNTGSLWGGLYPLLKGFFIHPDDVEWIDFDQARDIAEQLGIPFHYQDTNFLGEPTWCVPLAFNYVSQAAATIIDNDDSGFYGGAQYYPCSAIGWYNDQNGNWVCDGVALAISGAGANIILRADTTAIKPLFGQYDSLTHVATLVQFDYGRLPEKWFYDGFTNYVPYISDNPWGVNPDFASSNNSILWRHYGPDSGINRGCALIWPRNMADYVRNHITSLYTYNEWGAFAHYPTLNYWGSIPRDVTNGISGPPRKIDFTEDETVIYASDIGYAYVDIIQNFHDFSAD